MKNSITLLFALMVLVSSCSRDDSSSAQNNNGEQEVEMTLTSTLTYTTRATDEGSESERQIKEIDLLICDKDGLYSYRREGYKSTNTGKYRATLKIEDNITIYFLINCRALLDEYEKSGVLAEGANWGSDIQPKLVDITPQKFSGDDLVLPMFGSKNANITDQSVNNLGTVPLVRSVASIDAYVKTDKDVFELTEMYLYFVPDQGFLAPRDANFNAGVVYAPDSPGDMLTNVVLKYDNITSNTVLNKLYLYDNKKISSRKHTRVILGGKYSKSNKVTYYPLDFYRGDEFIEVLRNTKYVMTITDVNGEGYETPDEASEAAAVNMDYDVIPWDLFEDEDIIIDGPNFISVAKKKVQLSRAQGSKYDLPFTTSYSKEDIEMSFVTNSRFAVEIIEETGSVTYLRFKALADYNTGNVDSNRDTLNVKAGRISMQIQVNQINSDIKDWNNGGTNDVELGEKE